MIVAASTASAALMMILVSAGEGASSAFLPSPPRGDARILRSRGLSSKSEASSSSSVLLGSVALRAFGADDEGGSGIFYDGDPSAMNRAYYEGSEDGDSEAGGGSGSDSGRPRPPKSRTRRRRPKPPPPGSVPRDVVIVGGGLAGLSAALRLALHPSGPPRHVTILEREDPRSQMSRTAAGSFAAAGMLAPQSERLPDGPLLDLCTRSRDGYSVFVDEVEGLARDSGERGRGYLWDDAAGGGRTALLSDDDDEEGEGGGGSGGGKGKEPWRVGYKSTGGFLAPAFAGDSVATWAPPSGSGSGGEGGGGGDPPPSAMWLDALQIRELEPLLHHDVVGGWWFPEDASVDARRLTCSLRAACVGAGVDLWTGKGCEVKSLELGGEFVVEFVLFIRSFGGFYSPRPH